MTGTVRQISDSDVAKAAANRVLRLAEKAKSAGEHAKAEALVEAAYTLFDESYSNAPAATVNLKTLFLKHPFLK
jgi:hypothetical protein